MLQTFIESGDKPRRARFIAACYAAYGVDRISDAPATAQSYDATKILHGMPTFGTELPLSSAALNVCYSKLSRPTARIAAKTAADPFRTSVRPTAAHKGIIHGPPFPEFAVIIL